MQPNEPTTAPPPLEYELESAWLTNPWATPEEQDTDLPGDPTMEPQPYYITEPS